jgi:hypothetical protein
MDSIFKKVKYKKWYQKNFWGNNQFLLKNDKKKKLINKKFKKNLITIKLKVKFLILS